MKYVLELLREKRRNLEIVKNKEVYIRKRYNKEEVKNWIEEKGLSGRDRKKIGGVSGGEILYI